jgi:multiubiquitin
MTDKHEVVIHIDGKEFKTAKTSMTGIEIKALAGRDASYQLFLEQKGSDPDKLIGDGETVELRNGEHFYTVPQATFG